MTVPLTSPRSNRKGSGGSSSTSNSTNSSSHHRQHPQAVASDTGPDDGMEASTHRRHRARSPRHLPDRHERHSSQQEATRLVAELQTLARAKMREAKRLRARRAEKEALHVLAETAELFGYAAGACAEGVSADTAVAPVVRTDADRRRAHRNRPRHVMIDMTDSASSQQEVAVGSARDSTAADDVRDADGLDPWLDDALMFQPAVATPTSQPGFVRKKWAADPSPLWYF